MEGRAISGCKTVLKMTASQIGEKVEDFSPIEIRTSDDGGFLFGNLQPGFYGIEFSQGGAPGGVFHYRPKYSGTISRKIVIQDKSVDLGDIPLYKAGLRIKGRVYVNGALRAGAEVFFPDKRWGFWARNVKASVLSTLTDQHGKYELTLPGFVPPEQIVVAARVGHPWIPKGKVYVSWALNSFKVDKPWQTVHLDLHCLPGDASIIGRVKDGKGGDVSGAKVLMYLPNVDSPWCWFPVATTGSDGSFSFVGIPAGAWRLAVAGPGALRKWLDLDLAPSRTVHVEILLDARDTGGISFTLDYNSSWGRFSEIIEKTKKLREDQASEYGVYLLSPDDDLLAPVVPVSVIAIKDRIPKTKVGGFEAGKHKVVVFPFERSSALTRSKVQFLVSAYPTEGIIPYAAGSSAVTIGPFKIMPNTTVQWTEIPTVDAKSVAKFSTKARPFAALPEFIIEIGKRLWMEEMIKQCEKE
jgi:hypothetical protein